jgi:hypothetical protein
MFIDNFQVPKTTERFHRLAAMSSKRFSLRSLSPLLHTHAEETTSTSTPTSHFQPPNLLHPHTLVSTSHTHQPTNTRPTTKKKRTTMPPKPTNPTTTPTNQTLNEREQRILINAIFHCAKSPVEIDYPKLAIVLGLKDRNSSKAAWHGVKKKIGAFAVGMKGDGELLTAYRRKTSSSLLSFFFVFF